MVNSNGSILKLKFSASRRKQNFPEDSLVNQQYDFIYQIKFIDPFLGDYLTARDYFDNKDYTAALVHINTFISHVPDNFTARQLKAYILYYKGEYNKCLEEIDIAMKLTSDTGGLYNLRGVTYYALNDLDSACKAFQSAMKVGNAEAKTNYDRYCKGIQQ